MKALVKDFFSFRRMLTPIIIQVIFWVGLLACIVTTINNLAHKHWVDASMVLILGPIIARIGCELLILFFRMNETLTDIKNKQSQF